eukprot:TRINITY_DN2093_c0_g1_i3.p1 TRINITY_DN2093_c0_g1~~TRINITY_DN2093_c0_g1_i3.p1  ORF type:complete len:523 (-),score=114.80 TRINITY_DN2093_c0_g1_i3:412-1980(-)
MCVETLATPAAQEAVVVVDPYSSGRFVLYELKERGIPIICVRSSLKVGQYFMKAYDKHKDYFVATLDYQEDKDLAALLEQLRTLSYKVIGVIAGSEPGVGLADALSEALQLRGNGTALSDARKDKAAMQERLKQCGVPHAEQVRASELGPILEWSRNFGQWPQVVKPVGSSGSDGVFFCKSEDDIVAAHSSLVGQLNPNGVVNNELAVQEFLAGDEYIVDTISRDGKHVAVAVWVYDKRRGTPWSPTCIISESNRLLPAKGEIQDMMVDYVFKVLDAVGLKWGPCHSEIMLTSRGPILVEVNARMHGLQGPHLIGLATGTSKAAYVADVLAGKGELFEKHYKAADAGAGRWLYPLQKHCLQFVIISPVEGYLQKSIAEQIEALQLASVIEVLPSVEPGQYLKQSTCLNTAAGNVLLVHASAEQLEADAKTLREAIDSGSVFNVTAKPVPSHVGGYSKIAVDVPASVVSSPRLRDGRAIASPLSGRSRQCSEDMISVTHFDLDDASTTEEEGEIVMSGLENVA